MSWLETPCVAFDDEGNRTLAVGFPSPHSDQPFRIVFLPGFFKSGEAEYKRFVKKAVNDLYIEYAATNHFDLDQRLTSNDSGATHYARIIFHNARRIVSDIKATGRFQWKDIDWQIEQ